MEQLILHLIGDYWMQSQWMAANKSKQHLPALIHALLYSLPFLLITGFWAWSVIFVTHFLIDRYRLIRYLLWIKNVIGCPEFWDSISRSVFGDILEQEDETADCPSWEDCQTTGYPDSMPPWLAVWLSIIADNTAHLLINYLAIRFL